MSAPTPVALFIVTFGTSVRPQEGEIIFRAIICPSSFIVILTLSPGASGVIVTVSSTEYPIPVLGS
jgi:hypothetical protein